MIWQKFLEDEKKFSCSFKIEKANSEDFWGHCYFEERVKKDLQGIFLE